MGRVILFFLLFPFFCAAQISFTEKAGELGTDVSYGDSNLGGGVSFHDFDNDGWDDITYATEEGQEVLFFKNNEGHFERVDLGINDLYETKQVLWVDYDNDGDKDFFATSITGLNKLYRNNGAMMFEDVTDTSGLFTANLFSYGAAFGDIDNDGDLDVFIVQRDIDTRDQYNYLYENIDGFFVEITQSAGLSLDNDFSFCASFFDYNNDGFQDIYVSNDKYVKPNMLYKNNGDNTFEDVSNSSNAGISIDAMSTTIDDYNYDGWLDIYVTNTSEGNYHLRNNGDGTFTNVASELGTTFNSFAWGAVYLDADNDADLDLYVSGLLDGGDGRLPSAFYKNSEGLFGIPLFIGFEEDTRRSYANAIGDVNNDGLADIIVMNDTEDNFLWVNESDNQNNWLKIVLEGVQSNKDGIGSTIELLADGQVQYRYTVCGEGYLAQNSSFEFFGVKDAESIDYIKVKWLSGVEDYIEDINVNTAFKLVEGSGTLIELYRESAEEEEEEDNFEDEMADGNDDEVNTFLDEGVSEMENELTICSNGAILYPNPSSDGNVNICADEFSGNVNINIFDTSGKLVLKKTMQPNEGYIVLSELPSGLYYLKMTDTVGKSMTKRLLKP